MEVTVEYFRVNEIMHRNCLGYKCLIYPDAVLEKVGRGVLPIASAKRGTFPSYADRTSGGSKAAALRERGACKERPQAAHAQPGPCGVVESVVLPVPALSTDGREEGGPRGARPGPLEHGVYAEQVLMAAARPGHPEGRSPARAAGDGRTSSHLTLSPWAIAPPCLGWCGRLGPESFDPDMRQ